MDFVLFSNTRSRMMICGWSEALNRGHRLVRGTGAADEPELCAR